MIRNLSSCAMLLSALYVTSASADWQYTKWEMTSEQVRAAAGGKATTLSNEEQTANSAKDSSSIALLGAPYSSGQFQFTAIFSFDKNSGALNSVRLKLNSPDKAPVLLGTLRTKYGTPDSEKSSPLLSYAIWYKEGDKISYVNIGGKLASVDYAPRNTTDNEGL